MHELDTASASIDPTLKGSPMGEIEDPSDDDQEKFFSVAVWILGGIGLLLITIATAAVILAVRALISAAV